MVDGGPESKLALDYNHVLPSPYGITRLLCKVHDQIQEMLQLSKKANIFVEKYLLTTFTSNFLGRWSLEYQNAKDAIELFPTEEAGLGNLKTLPENVSHLM